jgi:hypothetical protein
VKRVDENKTRNFPGMNLRKGSDDQRAKRVTD